MVDKIIETAKTGQAIKIEVPEGVMVRTFVPALHSVARYHGFKDKYFIRVVKCGERHVTAWAEIKGVRS
jgi:hypothetical protein